MVPLHKPLRRFDSPRRRAPPLFRRQHASEVRRLRGAAPLDGDNDQPAAEGVVPQQHRERSTILGTRLPPFNCVPELLPWHFVEVLRSCVGCAFGFSWI